MNDLTHDNILPTENEGYGFYGTVWDHVEDADAVWADAMLQIHEATNKSHKAVRAFLDSKYGRKFADTLISNLSAFSVDIDEAISLAIDKWMDHKVGLFESRATGIPKGQPALPGYIDYALSFMEGEEG